MLKDTNPQQSSNPLWFQEFRGEALFEVLDASANSQLYRTDGTTAGRPRLVPSHDGGEDARVAEHEDGADGQAEHSS